jgi:hypothetical protein
MDPASIVLPGMQALVTQILSDGWAQARGWLAKRLSRTDGPSQADLEQWLDTARAQASSLPVPQAGVQAAVAQRMMQEAYWTGYLAAMAVEHADFASALTELSQKQEAQPIATTSNSVTGTVTGNVLQAGHIEGGVHFG